MRHYITITCEAFSDNTLPPGTHRDLQVKLHYQNNRNNFTKNSSKKRVWYALGFLRHGTPTHALEIYTVICNHYHETNLKNSNIQFLKPKTPSPIQQFLSP